MRARCGLICFFVSCSIGLLFQCFVFILLLQMADNEYLSDGSVDDDLQPEETLAMAKEDAFNEVWRHVLPHLIDPTKEEEAKERLRTLGVDNMSLLKAVKDEHVMGFVKIVSFRVHVDSVCAGMLLSHWI